MSGLSLDCCAVSILSINRFAHPRSLAPARPTPTHTTTHTTSSALERPLPAFAASATGNAHNRPEPQRLVLRKSPLRCLLWTCGLARTRVWLRALQDCRLRSLVLLVLRMVPIHRKVRVPVHRKDRVLI